MLTACYVLFAGGFTAIAVLGHLLLLQAIIGKPVPRATEPAPRAAEPAVVAPKVVAA